jgi:hypothetical protein
MSRGERAKDRQRRRQRVSALIAGEDLRDLLDAFGRRMNLSDGEVRTKFRDGHLVGVWFVIDIPDVSEAGATEERILDRLRLN